MIINKEKHIVLKCSECNTDFSVSINIFKIGGCGVFKAFCPACGEKILSISGGHDHNISLDINCFICGEEHSYSLTPAAFWQDGLFALPCGGVNMDICFAGSTEEAESAMQSLNKSLDEIQTQFEAEVAQNTGSCMISALNHLYDLSKSGKIFCICNDNEINISAQHAGIEISCNSCGATEYIPVENEKELKSFLVRKSIVLISSKANNGSRARKSLRAATSFVKS